MKLIKYGVYTGKENMQIDSDLLENAITEQSTEPVFRIYGWSPRCVSLGRNQNSEFIYGSTAANDRVDVVRRLTGGRALLHDDEVTYSYVTPVSAIPNGDRVKESYKYISGILIDFFKTLGVTLEFGGDKKISAKYDYCMLISTGADVCHQGKKVIGSAQFRKNGYILQHGSILFGYDKEFLENLFHEEVKGITTVRDILPDITKPEFIEKLEKYIEQH